MGQRRNRSFVLPLLLFIIATVIVAISLGFQAQVGQGPLSYILAPPQSLLSNIGQAIVKLFGDTSNISDLRERNLVLEKRLKDLTNENTCVIDNLVGAYGKELKLNKDKIIKSKAIVKIIKE